MYQITALVCLLLWETYHTLIFTASFNLQYVLYIPEMIVINATLLNPIFSCDPMQYEFWQLAQISGSMSRFYANVTAVIQKVI